MSASTWDDLNRLTGGLSRPGKMPGPAWSISAKLCNVGSRLRAIPGSACRTCYALKGRYVFPNVQRALDRRLEAYNANPPEWEAGMAASILKSGTNVFRWFDSGDLQSAAMLGSIIRVCQATPKVRHWLPTRERKALEGQTLPPNLVVRVSAGMVGAPAPKIDRQTSVIRAKGVAARPSEHPCPAPMQGGKCLTCRACWSPEVQTVSYSVH